MPAEPGEFGDLTCRLATLSTVPIMTTCSLPVVVLSHASASCTGSSAASLRV